MTGEPSEEAGIGNRFLMCEVGPVTERMQEQSLKSQHATFRHDEPEIFCKQGAELERRTKISKTVSCL